MTFFTDLCMLSFVTKHDSEIIFHYSFGAKSTRYKRSVRHVRLNKRGVNCWLLGSYIVHQPTICRPTDALSINIVKCAKMLYSGARAVNLKM